MKHIILLIFVSMLAVLMLACQKKAESFLVEQEEYASKINSKIDQLESEISELKAELAGEADSLGIATDSTITAMEVELEHRIQKLEQEKNELNEKFQQIWQTNHENWDALKTEIDNQLANVQKYLDEELTVSLK